MKKKRVGIQSIPAAIGVGTGISMLVTLFGVGILAWLLNTERLQENIIGYATVIILLLSSFAGANMAVSMNKEKRMIISLITGAAYLLTLLACTALFFGGQYQGVGVTGLVVLAGCISTAILGLGRSKKSPRARHKYRNR